MGYDACMERRSGGEGSYARGGQILATAALRFEEPERGDQRDEEDPATRHNEYQWGAVL